MCYIFSEYRVLDLCIDTKFRKVISEIFMNGSRVCCTIRNSDKSGQALTNFSQFIMCVIFSQHWVFVSCVDTSFRYDIYRILRYGTGVCCRFRNYNKSG